MALQQFRILCPYTPNHGQGYIHEESNPKSSTLHYESHKVLVKCKCHVKVELKLFQGICSIWVIWGNWTLIPQIMGWDTKKILSSLQHQILHLMWSLANFHSSISSGQSCFVIDFSIWAYIVKLGNHCTLVISVQYFKLLLLG